MMPRLLLFIRLLELMTVQVLYAVCEDISGGSYLLRLQPGSIYVVIKMQTSTILTSKAGFLCCNAAHDLTASLCGQKLLTFSLWIYPTDLIHYYLACLLPGIYRSCLMAKPTILPFPFMSFAHCTKYDDI